MSLNLDMFTKSRTAFFENKKPPAACTTAGSNFLNTHKSNYVTSFDYYFALFYYHFALFDYYFALVITIDHYFVLFDFLFAVFDHYFPTTSCYCSLILTNSYYFCLLLINLSFHCH